MSCCDCLACYVSLSCLVLPVSPCVCVCAATSSCDPATDQAIQQALQAESSEHGTTVLTIAHRLHTILDCHKVLVLRAGQVAEFAAPGALLADPASEFSRMLSDYNSSHSR